MTTESERITPLLAGMDTVYFSCDLPLSDAMRERLTQEKADCPGTRSPAAGPLPRVAGSANRTTGRQGWLCLPHRDRRLLRQAPW